MGNAILVETCIVGALLITIYVVMVSREKTMENRSWFLGVMVIGVLLYIIAVALTTIINTRFGY